MGVINEYFVAKSDQQAAGMLDSGPVDGVLGPDPTIELGSLEAILRGVDPSGDEAAAMMERPEHARLVAHDVDYSRMITHIADDAVALIADTPPERLASAMASWATAGEFVNTPFTEDEIAQVFTRLGPLIQRAHSAGLHVYAWTSL